MHFLTYILVFQSFRVFNSWLAPQAAFQLESDEQGLLPNCHFNNHSIELLNLNPFTSLSCQNRLALFHRKITFIYCECRIF